MYSTPTIAIGCFIGSMIYLTIRDYRFYKRHRITTPENDRMVRGWSFTPKTNVFDALIITAGISALHAAILQISG